MDNPLDVFKDAPFLSHSKSLDLPSVCTAESVTDVPKQIVSGVSEIVDLFGFSTKMVTVSELIA